MRSGRYRISDDQFSSPIQQGESKVTVVGQYDTPSVFQSLLSKKSTLREPR